LQHKCRYDQIERRVCERQRLLVSCYTQEGLVSGVNVGRDNRSDLPACRKHLAHCIGRSTEIDRDVKLTQHGRKALSQLGRSAVEQKSCRAKLVRTRLPCAEKLPIEYVGAWRHSLVRLRALVQLRGSDRVTATGDYATVPA
jgi:hypothetical protein